MIITEAYLIIVLIETFIIGFLIGIFRKIIDEGKKDTLIENEDSSFNLKELYKNRANNERKIFIVETFLKFIPPAILSVIISLFYLGSQDINYWDIHITIYLLVIISIMTVIELVLYLKSIKLHEINYPIINKIESKEKYVTLNLMEEFENLKTQEVERRDKKEKERINLEHEREFIKQLRQILENLRDSTKRSLVVKEFSGVCSEKVLRGTVNPELITLIRNCIDYMDINEMENFLEMTKSINSLVNFSITKEHFLAMRENINDKYNSILKQMQDLRRGNLKIFLRDGHFNDFIHTHVNICNNEQFDTILGFFNIVKEEGNTQFDRCIDFVLDSYYLNTYYDQCKKTILQLTIANKDNKYYKNMYGTMAKNKKGDLLQRGEYAPWCFKYLDNGE